MSLGGKKIEHAGPKRGQGPLSKRQQKKAAAKQRRERDFKEIMDDLIRRYPVVTAALAR